MRRKLIIDGNAVYEIDDECICSNEEQKTLTGSIENFSQIMTDVSERYASKSAMVKKISLVMLVLDVFVIFISNLLYA